MLHKRAARAAIVTAATAVAASSAIAFGGLALATDHGSGYGGNGDNDGGHGGNGGQSGVGCQFHGPTDIGNHTDNPNQSNCSAIGSSNGARGGNGY
jgi:predicted porin